LGQLFPAFSPAAPKHFITAFGPGAGKKAVFRTTFSFGRLVCSFHEAWIIVKFISNIQRIISSKIFFSIRARSGFFPKALLRDKISVKSLKFFLERI